MTSSPIYFDNAATSWPKPEVVYQACDKALRHAGNPGRGAHRLALDSARVMFDGREAIGALFNAPSQCFAFTSGCTASINLVLNGLLSAGLLASGDTILCSSYEHNAVMRPLQWLSDHKGLRVIKVAPAVNHQGLVDAESLKASLETHRPKLCIFSLASNVSGEKLDLHLVESLCRQQNIALLIDGAQGAGLIDVDLSALSGITYFAASAHKGLLGPAGLGFLYARNGGELTPLFCGGTGSASESLVMPTAMPDHLEPGTQAVQLVAGLTAAIEYLQQNKMQLREKEAQFGEYFSRYLEQMSERITIYGRGTAASATSHLPTFALVFKGKTADIIAGGLDSKFDIAVRAGLHCAVSAHQTLGTVSGGLVRVSFGASNTVPEIDSLCDAIESLL
jgi:cysteine desulfurase/selenocysteine lyase